MPSVFTFTLIFHRFDDGCCGPEDLKNLTDLKYFFSARNIGLFCNLLLSGKETAQIIRIPYIPLAENLTEDVTMGGPHMVFCAGGETKFEAQQQWQSDCCRTWPTAV